MSTDPLRSLDDPDHPVLTMSQAAELLGVQAAFLRSLDSGGVLSPYRSPGGHRRYSRAQLRIAARIRVLLDDGHPLSSAQVIVRFANGASGSIEASWIAMGRKMQHDFEVYGTKGALLFTQERFNELHFYSAEDAPGRRGFRRI